MREITFQKLEFNIIFDNGRWGFRHESEFRSFDKAESCTFLTPLLEGHFANVNKFLEKELMDDQKALSSFPFLNILKYVSSNSSSYSINNGLNWLDEGFKIDEEVILQLQKLIENKNIDQKTRHRISAFLNRKIYSGI